MTLREVALRYSEYLLTQMRISATLGRWTVVLDLCDRFERLMANLPYASQPLVWDGDSA